MTPGAWFCTGLSIGVLVGALIGYLLSAAILGTPLPPVQDGSQRDRLEPGLTKDDHC